MLDVNFEIKYGRAADQTRITCSAESKWLVRFAAVSFEVVRLRKLWDSKRDLKDLNEITPLRPKTHPHVKVYIEKPKQEHEVELHPLGPQN